MALLIRSLKYMALFLLGTIMAIVGIYFFWMLAIVYMLLTGSLRKGEMFHDGVTTPEWGDTTVALLACMAVIGVCLWLRHLVKKTLPPTIPAEPH
ncbi:MAG: hypothetical protein EON92_00310 [Burkholderiales bacterium]|nr:MAG: hypothetical protein EON92_00310 [Burkholderiales bacterium]